jgi:hypothetical protein
MHPVAPVSTNICRNLRTQQMSVLKHTEAMDPLTHAVTDFEFFVLQTT